MHAVKPPKGKLLHSVPSRKSNKQHQTPCSDCPWRRDSLPGWLGELLTAEDFIAIAHGEEKYPCHVIVNQECAGMAVYQRNVCKTPRDPMAFRLPADRDKVFATPMQFLEHHNAGTTRPEPLPSREDILCAIRARR